MTEPAIMIFKIFRKQERWLSKPCKVVAQSHCSIMKMVLLGLTCAMIFFNLQGI